MDGVTILQTIPQYTHTWGWHWFLLLPILATVGLFVAVIYICIDGDCELGGYLAGFAALFIVITLAFASNVKPEFSHNQYQVMVEDSVSMTEFTDKYNIVEQQGITYIVEEKTEG